MTAAARRPLGSRLRAAFTERLAAKTAALVLALLLWLLVTLQATSELWVEVRLDLSVDSGYALVDPRPPTVRALVSGRGRDLLELTLSHPVAHVEATDAGDDVAVIAFATSDIEFPPGVDARVRDVRPRVVRLKLRRAP